MDLANDHKFAKISSVKIPCPILLVNNIINVQICFANYVFVVKFVPTKVFLYTVKNT